MKLFLVISLGISGALFSATSSAQNKACMIEGSMVIMGQKIDAKDCLQVGANDSEKTLRDSCEGLAQATVAFGGKAGKVTYLPTCTKPAQGICSGLGGSKSDAYYYKRDPEDLKSLPKSCEMTGGKWKSGK